MVRNTYWASVNEPLLMVSVSISILYPDNGCVCVCVCVSECVTDVMSLPIWALSVGVL